MSEKFKYQEDYDRLAHTCPPDDFTPKDLNPVFRWVFETMEDERNFSPQYHRNPKRFLDKEDTVKCKAMGLSMFANLDDSVTRFNELKKQIGTNVYRTLGNKNSTRKYYTNRWSKWVAGMAGTLYTSHLRNSTIRKGV